MEIVYLMLPMALLLGGAFVWAFVWASRRGQFEDLKTPALRILFDDDTGDGSPTGSGVSERATSSRLPAGAGATRHEASGVPIRASMSGDGSPPHK